MLKKMLAVATFLVASPAMADTVTNVVVKTGGVDFNSHAQVQAFYHHIRAVATDACSTPSNSVLAVYEPVVDKECVNRAVADAVQAINRPVLTAYYDASPDAANRALAGNDQ